MKRIVDDRRIKFQRKSSPFRRVREEEADPNYLKKIGKNAFEHKVSMIHCVIGDDSALTRCCFQAGAQGSWGEKANADLIKTRGKSFRHEKTKKKRGSYHGGKIDSTNSYSIKFDDSDE